MIDPPEAMTLEAAGDARGAQPVGRSLLWCGDAFERLSAMPEGSLHAVVTDPPYGLKEYTPAQMKKRREGTGGVWRVPPTLDGNTRSALPRFTALNLRERELLRRFFTDWSALVLRALRPGGHVFVAGNAFLSQMVFSAIVDGGLEFRGEIVRLVRTMRGGDRPKNAEEEFAGVSSMPRGCYEPWGLFRKALPAGMRVSDCLREFQTGGLRRDADKPFADVIESERTPQRERRIAPHPSLKPQSLMRRLVRASLPLGVGVVCDPFMGSGATVAAAEALGLSALGIERDEGYFAMARSAIPRLAALRVGTRS